MPKPTTEYFTLLEGAGLLRRIRDDQTDTIEVVSGGRWVDAYLTGAQTGAQGVASA